MHKLIIIAITLFQLGCSLGPSAANRSYKAYDSGDYVESIRLVNRALLTYEYTNNEKANLLFLKAENYAKLKQYTLTYGVIQYILQTYPESEAFYRAKTLLSTVSQYRQKQPMKVPNIQPKNLVQGV